MQGTANLKMQPKYKTFERIGFSAEATERVVHKRRAKSKLRGIGGSSGTCWSEASHGMVLVCQLSEEIILELLDSSKAEADGTGELNGYSKLWLPQRTSSTYLVV